MSNSVKAQSTFDPEKTEIPRVEMKNLLIKQNTVYNP